MIISKVKSYLEVQKSLVQSSIIKSGDKYFSPGENIIVSQKNRAHNNSIVDMGVDF